MIEKKTLVIIPAAGEASRLRPITSSASKAMVPVAGKPCIDWIMDRFDPNTHHVVVVTNPGLHDLDTHLSVRYPGEVMCIKQENFTENPGPMDAIKTASTYTNPREFKDVIVWLGDTIVEPDYDISQSFDKYPMTFLVSRVDDASQWCCWDPARGVFIDKSQHSTGGGYALIGVYHWDNPTEFFENVGEIFENLNYEDHSPEIADLLHLSQDRKWSENSIDAVAEYEAHRRIGGFEVKNAWLDIGQFHTYYKTNAYLIEKFKSRVFNQISIDLEQGTITKTSTKPEILEPEIQWYKHLDDNQQKFVPRVWPPHHKNNQLVLSMEPGILLSDVLVWDNLPESSWRWIISKIFSVMDKYFWGMHFLGNVSNKMKKSIHEMWFKKTANRLKQVSGFSPGTSLDLLCAAEEVSQARYGIPRIADIHGDLHSGNIIFNFDMGTFKLIDPRGEWAGEYSNRGDSLYDLAKMSHDFFWGYNAIVADVEPNRQAHNAFHKVMSDNFSEDVVRIINLGGLILLATCIPLHYEDPARQKRMINVVEQARKDGWFE